MTLAVLGLQSAFSGVLAQVVSDYSPDSGVRWKARSLYPDRPREFRIFLLGALLVGMLLVEYFVRGQAPLVHRLLLDHLAVTGLMFVIMGFSTFCFTLLLHATGVKFGRSTAQSSNGV